MMSDLEQMTHGLAVIGEYMTKLEARITALEKAGEDLECAAIEVAADIDNEDFPELSTALKKAADKFHKILCS